MFKINDKIIHFRDGIATIVGKTTMGDKEYFVIHTESSPDANIYVATTNTTNVIRPIMTKAEASSLLKSLKKIEQETFNNTKQRRDFYKKKLLSGNVEDLLYLTGQLYYYDYSNAHGKIVKLGPTDLQMLKDAKKVLFDELLISLNKNEKYIDKFFLSLLK